MTKKLLVLGFAAVILCLCCSVSFASENNNSITLGNEIMQSIDKTGDSFNNMMSGNMVTDTANSVRNGVEDVRNGMMDGVNTIQNGTMRTNQNYNVTQTTTEGNIGQMGMNTMTTTTWMWIILAVAAIIIIAAIWYYATQSND